MNKEEALKKINESDSDDLEVFEKTEHETYLENFKTQSVNTKVSEEIGKVHKSYDDDLFELFGERKPGDEKTYNFLKRKFTDLKANAETAEEFKVKISELEDALKNNTGDEQLKRDLQKTRDEYKGAKEEWESEKTKYSTDLSTYKLSTELDKAMFGLKFKEDIPQEVKDTFVERVKTDLLKSARIVDNKMIFVGDDGATLANKDNSLNPYTPQEMLTKALDSILSKAKTLNGLPKAETIIVDGKEVTTLPNPNAKSRQEVTQYLKENGIARGSKDYIRMYGEFCEHLPPLR